MRSRYASENQTYTQAQQLAAVLAVSQKCLVTSEQQSMDLGLYLHLAFVFTCLLSISCACAYSCACASVARGNQALKWMRLVRSSTLFTFGYPNLMLSLLQYISFYFNINIATFVGFQIAIYAYVVLRTFDVCPAIKMIYFAIFKQKRS